MAVACENACNNDLIGYDQATRNSLNLEASKVNYDLSKVSKLCSADCSSLMTICAQAAGIAVPYVANNAPTTKTMEKAFVSTGMFDVLRDKIYLESPDYLRRGDILVKEGQHTVMVLDNVPVVSYPTIKKGSKNEFVGKAQAALNIKGHKCDIDNDFGSETERSVIAFQGMSNGKLKKDGIIGAATWKALLN